MLSKPTKHDARVFAFHPANQMSYDITSLFESLAIRYGDNITKTVQDLEALETHLLAQSKKLPPDALKEQIALIKRLKKGFEGMSYVSMFWRSPLYRP